MIRVTSWLSTLLAAAGSFAAHPIVAPIGPGSAGASELEVSAGELVRFSSDPREGRSPAVLEGVLRRPVGAGPFPAIAMLHGCSGLRTRTGAVQAKPRFWAEHLHGLGYVTLLVDSFTTRGIDEVCTGRHLLSPVRDRADDARGALRYLQALPGVRADRVGLLGWSNGAAATLSTLFDEGSAERDFRAAVAFYPNCTPPVPRGTGLPALRAALRPRRRPGRLDAGRALRRARRARPAPAARRSRSRSTRALTTASTPPRRPSATGPRCGTTARRPTGAAGRPWGPTPPRAPTRSPRSRGSSRPSWAGAASSRPGGAVSGGRTPPRRGRRRGGRWPGRPWRPATGRSGRGSRPWTWRSGSRRRASRRRRRPGRGRPLLPG